MKRLLETVDRLIAEANELEADAMNINNEITEKLNDGYRFNGQLKCQQIEAAKMIKLAGTLNGAAS